MLALLALAACRADFDPSPEAVELQSVGATDQCASQYDTATGALLPVE